MRSPWQLSVELVDRGNALVILHKSEQLSAVMGHKKIPELLNAKARLSGLLWMTGLWIRFYTDRP